MSTVPRDNRCCYVLKSQLNFGKCFRDRSVKMKSAKSAIQGPNNEADIDLAEYERETFTKLHNDLRLLEKDREVQRWQTRQLIQQQEREMAQLMEYQDRLQRELGMKNDSFEQNSEDEDVGKLQELIHLSNDLDEQLETEAQAQQRVRNETSDLELKLLELRKDGMDPKDRQAQRRRNVRAQRLLEDKLQRAVMLVNEHVCRNGELRDETQTMHEGWTHFQRLAKALKKERREVQQKIKEVTKEYTALCEASVQSHQKRAEMRGGGGKERAEYNAEMQRLQLITLHDQGLRGFLWAKHEDRRSSQDHSKGEDAKGRETVESLETLKDGLRAVTGEDDLDKLLLGFTQAEDQNFALFKFVNEQNKEIEALKVEIEQVQLEIDRFEVRRQEGKLIHTAKMEELSKQLREVEARTAEYKNQTSDRNNVLKEIEEGVNSIFSKIGCDSDSSFGSYLRAIEQRINEMLTIKDWTIMQQQTRE